jgi:PST family polysaccharide transporter
MRGLAWTGAAKWLSQFLSWASTLVVARLLTPDDYGLVGMAMVYMGLVTLLNEFGLGAGIIAKPDLSKEQIAQLNGFSLLLGFASCGISYVASFPVSRFFGSADLQAVVAVMGVALVLSAVRTVPGALLEKDMEFKTLAFIDGLQSFAQASSAVVLAWVGLGYWALVVSSLIGGGLATVLTVAWRPCGYARPYLHAVREALTISWHLLATRLAAYASSSSDMLITGRVLGQAALGMYSIGWTIAMVPVEKVTSLVARVAFPLFASLQKDHSAVRQYLLSLTEGLALITFPLAAGLSLTAQDFVLIALGPKWQDAVLPLQILAGFTAMKSLTPLFPHILNVTGGSRFGMYVGFWCAIIGPVFFYAGSHWGAAGVAMAWIVVHPLCMFPVYYRVVRTIGLRSSQYFRSLTPAFSGSCAMTIFLLSIKWIIPDTWSPVTNLGCQVAGGSFVYLGVVYVFFRPRTEALLRFVRSGWR